MEDRHLDPMNNHHYVAIMAGGIGSRFWPASRTSRPKQFLDILDTGKSLLRTTFERFLGICPPENIYVLTNLQYMEMVREQLPELGQDQVLGEPVRKNTAPAIAYVSTIIRHRDPDATMIVAPSDHIILDEVNYLDTCRKALTFAAMNDALLTLGIRPTRPDTGYGYIQFLEPSVTDDIFKVKTFTEKPDLHTAKKFLESGEFLWNAGIFIWHVKSILQALELRLPDVSDVFQEFADALGTDKEQAALNRAFQQCPGISVDFGIMEKAGNVYVLPSSFGWSDLGTWASLYAEKDKDEHLNAVSGNQVMLYGAGRNIISAPRDKLVVIQGLENCIVVDTGDVLLICDKDQEQSIKQITQDIRRQGGGYKFL